MEKINCLRCNFRHTDNGNCTAIGGFCTAVAAAYCSLLREYLDTGLTPERCAEFARADAEGRYIVMRDAEQEGVARLREIAEADKDGRCVVLPCKVGERWTDEDGRAVRITAVIVSIEPFGMNINIYFDYEDATPDDAGSDCVTNWDYFSRHYTCIEDERAMEEMEGKDDGEAT